MCFRQCVSANVLTNLLLVLCEGGGTEQARGVYGLRKKLEKTAGSSVHGPACVGVALAARTAAVTRSRVRGQDYMIAI